MRRTADLRAELENNMLKIILRLQSDATIPRLLYGIVGIL
jgi:hypothetical protein